MFNAAAMSHTQNSPKDKSWIILRRVESANPLKTFTISSNSFPSNNLDLALFTLSSSTYFTSHLSSKSLDETPFFSDILNPPYDQSLGLYTRFLFY